MKPFEIKLDIRWSDVDMNRHVRHSAYYDYGAHARIQLMNEIGFTVEKMGELGIGPILFEEQCHFLRELHLNTEASINVLKGKMAPDGSRWEMYHEILKEGDSKLAHIKVKGAWIDLKARKLTVPPADLAERFLALPEGNDFVYKK